MRVEHMRQAILEADESETTRSDPEFARPSFGTSAVSQSSHYAPQSMMHQPRSRGGRGRGVGRGRPGRF